MVDQGPLEGCKFVGSWRLVQPQTYGMRTTTRIGPLWKRLLGVPGVDPQSYRRSSSLSFLIPAPRAT